MSRTFSWGIIGTGKIAHIFAAGLAKSETGRLIAVASRSQEAADRFGRRWNISRCYRGYDRLLADNEVEVVYIATPHSMHAELSIQAANAKKHILCEKPLGLNYKEARAMIDAAQRNNVFLLEAFMYRFHPQTARLVTLIREGVIGKIQLIQALFSIHAVRDPAGRLLNNALGGGGILDVGCYCTSFARMIAGAAIGRAFAEPVKLSAHGYIGDTHVDEYAIASLEFPENILAQLACGIQMNAGIRAHIYGSDGYIFIPTPFTPIREGKHLAFVIKRNDEQEARSVFMDNDKNLYALEADAVAHSIEELQAPQMTWNDTLGNMVTLDKWRAAIGLVYEIEQA